MAHGISTRLRGMFAAAIALVAALLLIPGTAFAAKASNNSLTVSGVENGDTVKIYKVVDFTYATDGSNTYSWDFTHNFGLDKTAYMSYQSSTDDMTNAANTMATYVRTQSVSATDSGTASGDPASVTFNNLEPGQYLVTVTPKQGSTKIYENAIATIGVTQDKVTGAWTSSEGDANMTLKSSDAPTPSKTIGDAASTAKSSDGYGLNDHVPFNVTVPVPKYPDSYSLKTFNIGDTMSEGLTFDTDSLHVFVDDEDVTGNVEYYSLASGDDLGTYTFMVVFNYEKVKDATSVKLTYTAQVNEKAIATSDQGNKATVEYSNGTDTLTKTDETKVYTYKVVVNKVASDTQTPLEGAEFTLYKPSKQGVKGATQLSDGSWAIAIRTESTVKGEDGKASLSFDALGSGTYYLVETKAPANYQLDSSVHTVVLNGAKVTIDNKDTTSPDYVGTVTLENKGDIPALPTTGGMGTIVFTAVGVVIIAGAVAFIVKSRKQNN